MQVSAKTLALLNQLVINPNLQNYAVGYNAVLQDLKAQNPNPSAADQQVLNWLSIAYDVNSGATTFQTIGVRAVNQAAVFNQLGTIINLFGPEEQNSSNRIALSFLGTIADQGGTVPDFEHIQKIDAQTGVAALGISEYSWSGTSPGVVTGFTNTSWYDQFGPFEQGMADSYHLIAFSTLSNYYAALAATGSKSDADAFATSTMPVSSAQIMGQGGPIIAGMVHIAVNAAIQDYQNFDQYLQQQHDTTLQQFVDGSSNTQSVDFKSYFTQQNNPNTFEIAPGVSLDLSPNNDAAVSATLSVRDFLNPNSGYTAQTSSNGTTLSANNQNLNFTGSNAPNVSILANGDVNAGFLNSTGTGPNLDLSTTGITFNYDNGKALQYLMGGSTASVDGVGNTTFTASTPSGGTNSLTIPSDGSDATFVSGGMTLRTDSGALMSVSANGPNIDFGLNMGSGAANGILSLNQTTGDAGLQISPATGANYSLPLGTVPQGGTVQATGTNVDVTNASGQYVSGAQVSGNAYAVYNYSGAGGTTSVQIVNPTNGVTTEQDTITASGITRAFYDPISGTWLYTAQFDNAGNLLAPPKINSQLQPNEQIQLGGAIISSLAGQIISRFVFQNNLPASVLAQSFAQAGIQSVEQSLQNVQLTAGGFATNLAASLTGMVGGILGNTVGVDISNLTGIPTQLGQLIGSATVETAAQYLTTYIANEAFGTGLSAFGLSAVSPIATLGGSFDNALAAVGLGDPATAVSVPAITDLSDIAVFADNLGTAFLDAGITLAASDLVNFLIPSNNTAAQIGGAIGATIGSLTPLGPIGAGIGDIIGTLVGDFFNWTFGDGYRGRPHAGATVGYDPARGGFIAFKSGGDNGANVQVAIELATGFANQLNAIVKDMGISITGIGPLQYSLGYIKNQFYYAPGDVGPPSNAIMQFSDPTVCVSAAVMSWLQQITFTGGDPDMVAAFQESLGGSLPNLITNINAAAAYSQYAANPMGYLAALAASSDPNAMQTFMTQLSQAQALNLDKPITTLTIGQTIISGNNLYNFMGAGGRDYVTRYPSGEITVYEVDPITGQYLGGKGLSLQDGVTPFAILAPDDRIVGIISASGTTFGSAPNDRDLIARNSTTGAITVYGIDASTGKYLYGHGLLLQDGVTPFAVFSPTEIVIGGAANWSGSTPTERDIITRDSNTGGLTLYAFDPASGKYLYGHGLAQPNSAGIFAISDPAAMVFAAGNNNLGIGDHDLVIRTSDGKVTAYGFNNNGQLVGSSILGDTAVISNGQITSFGSAGADIITALAAGETLAGNGGGDTFKGTIGIMPSVTINGFDATSDQIDFINLNPAGVSVSLSFTSGITSINLSEGLVTTSASLTGNYTSANFVTASDGNGGTLVTDPLPCFAAGTLIQTANGEEKPVESLREGDLVQTADGETKAIRWIGQRKVDITRHPNPELAAPIRFVAGSIAPDVPKRDLLVSPDHAMYFDDVLIPAKLLVNGKTIYQDKSVKQVTYYHVELPEHDIVLAEGARVESYLDTGDRNKFSNSNGIVALHPDFSNVGGPSVPQIWEMRGYVHLAITGPEVDRIHTQLSERAGTFSCRAANDAGTKPSWQETRAEMTAREVESVSEDQADGPQTPDNARKNRRLPRHIRGVAAG